MWKDYIAGLLKNNRSFGLSVRLSAFISALLLSLLCGLFYNMWKYEVERIELEEGGWQSRIIGELDDETLKSIRKFASVKDISVNETGNREEKTTVDLYFYDYRTVLSDTPHIAELARVSPEAVIYNYGLLAMYGIRDSKDTAPRLLFPMFFVITALASISLIIMIHNSFAVSMNARIHQFGIFSSIGATPRQIRICLFQEAVSLCSIPILAGNGLGIAGSMGLMEMTNVLLGNDIPGRHEAIPGYHPLVLILTLALTIATVWISAWLPARKLSRLTPLEAIRNTGELQLKRRRKSRILTFLFGVEGGLAGNALKAQKKALRTASLSLICSSMAFTIMQCFFATSEISTRETYFERYQDAWDIMVTVRNVQVDEFTETEAIQELAGVESAVIYQKANAKRIIQEEEISEEMKAFGGFFHASERDVTRVQEGWMVNAPIIILDDASFLAYCEQIGIAPQLDGAVVRNQIRDVTNPDFRHPKFMPYIKPGIGESATSVLRQSGKEETTAEIPVLSYTEEVPVLREEYATLDYYELVHVVPVSLWKEIKGQIGGMEETLFIRILCRDHVTQEKLDTLQNQVAQIIGQTYVLESENRIQEYEINRKQIQGMRVIFGGFCVLLALIGIGDVFSNTLGFVRQRKREFARYLSVGLTPEQIKKMFCIEALVLAIRPILITLPLSVLAVGYMLKISYLRVGEFLAEAPGCSIALFALSIIGFVALAYAIAWRSMRKIGLAEILKDDTMM